MVAGRARSSSVGAHWRSSGAGGRGERALGVVEPREGGVEVTARQQQGRGEHAEHGAAPDRVVGQGAQPALHLGLLPVPADLRHGQLHEGGGPVDVPRQERVLDGVVGETVLLEPVGGARVQDGRDVGLLGEQAGAQHVAEQLVVAEPLPPVVEGDEEEVVALEGAQHRGRVTTVEDGVAQRPAEPVEHRGVQQELAHRGRLVGEHLLDEVVDDVAVVAGEPGDERRDVRAALQRDGGELQGRDPPLGAVLEGLDLRGGERPGCGCVEVVRGLAGGEPEVGRPHLDQLAPGPPARQRQVGVGAGAQHDVHVGREVLEQEGHPCGDGPAVDVVVVVEHEPHLAGGRGQVVEHGGEHGFGRVRRRA